MPGEALLAHEAARRADHRAREGHGAVYTPGWLADLIVRETLALAPPSPTICDPACGAGNLLIAARTMSPGSALFGVDRDPEAVALARQARPEADLAVGEALLGLDWERAFPGTGGSFDVLVGNPPFVRIQHLREHDSALADALTERYRTAEGNFDLYGPFLELALARMRHAAGFVLPHRFFKTEYGRSLRELLGPHVAGIRDFGDREIFPDMQIYACLLLLQRQAQPYFTYTRDWDQGEAPRSEPVDRADLSADVWNPLFAAERRAWLKLADGGVPLFGTAASPAAKCFVGLQTPSNRVFRLEILEGADADSLGALPAGDAGTVLVRSAAEMDSFAIERAVLRPLLMGADVRAFGIRDRGRALLFPYRDGELLDLPAVAPLAASYLSRHRHTYAAGATWWAYRYPKNLRAFGQPKILVGGVAPRGRYAFDPKGRYYVVGGGDGGYCLIPRPGVDPWALLGVLASTPLDFVLQRRSSLFNGRCYSYGRRFLHALPIRAEALTAEVASLGRALSQPSLSPPDALALEADLDRAVGEAYGLDAADWDALRNLVPPRKF
jgi:hypothetical protein